MCYAGCLGKISAFQKNLEQFFHDPSLPWADAIGRSENAQPIGVAVHNSHCFENFEELMLR